jgi:hypothetical protein
MMSDPTSTSRRELVTVTGAAAVGAPLFPDEVFAQSRAKRRYAIVGTGESRQRHAGRDQNRPVRIADLVKL